MESSFRNIIRFTLLALRLKKKSMSKLAVSQSTVPGRVIIIEDLGIQRTDPVLRQNVQIQITNHLGNFSVSWRKM